MDLTAARWSPYVVGAGIGLLSCLTFLLSDKALGCSTAFARTSGMLRRLFDRRGVERNPYYREVRPVVDWEWMLVLGVVLGALLSSLLSGTFELTLEHATWKAYFGDTPLLRVLTALAGGTAMGFGARWAGGCTSGHGISGTLQWSASSWLGAIMFFVGGIVAARLLFVVVGGGAP